MIKAIVAALRGSNNPRKDVVTRLVVNGEVYTDGDEVETSSTRVVNTGRSAVVSVTGNGNIVASAIGNNTVIGNGNVVSVGGCAYRTQNRVSSAKTTTVIVGKNCVAGFGRINLTTNLGLHQVKVQQNDRTSTIEIDGSQVHFNSPLSHQDGFDHTVNGVRIRISGHTVVIA
jgi:hypothetical protein